MKDAGSMSVKDAGSMSVKNAGSLSVNDAGSNVDCPIFQASSDACFDKSFSFSTWSIRSWEETECAVKTCVGEQGCPKSSLRVPHGYQWQALEYGCVQSACGGGSCETCRSVVWLERTCKRCFDTWQRAREDMQEAVRVVLAGSCSEPT